MLFVLCYLFCFKTSSQTRLEYSSEKLHNMIFFNVGDRIAYAKKGISRMRSGTLSEINDSTITIKGRKVFLKDIKFIGHRKKGTVLLLSVNSFIAGLLLGYGLSATDPNAALIGVGLSLPFFALSGFISQNNKIYKVSKKYTYAVKNY